MGQQLSRMTVAHRKASWRRGQEGEERRGEDLNSRGAEREREREQ